MTYKRGLAPHARTTAHFPPAKEIVGRIEPAMLRWSKAKEHELWLQVCGNVEVGVLLVVAVHVRKSV